MKNLKACSQTEINKYIRENKVIVDNNGTLCWVYNPKLYDKYAQHPELRIK